MKWVNFMMCKIYLNKSAAKKRKRALIRRKKKDDGVERLTICPRIHARKLWRQEDYT